MTFPCCPKTTLHHPKVLGEIFLGYRDVDASWEGRHSTVMGALPGALAAPGCTDQDNWDPYRMHTRLPVSVAHIEPTRCLHSTSLF